MDQANILVDDAGTARVADFGFMTMVSQSTFLSSESVSSGGTLYWMSPELFDPPRFGSNGRPTRESDRYALGMVVYEVRLPPRSLKSPSFTRSKVLTGLRPFHRKFPLTIVPAILKGERPERPLDAESLGFSDALWELVELCWSESMSTRPTAQRLFDHLSPASLAWVPPPVYPSSRGDVEYTTSSGSSGSLGKSLASLGHAKVRGPV